MMLETTEIPQLKPLSDSELHKMNAYWRAANYLSVGQIYLLDNPLLKEKLKLEHVKPRLLGHWGTTPGLNFIYVHLNRIIKAQDINAIYIAGLVFQWIRRQGGIAAMEQRNIAKAHLHRRPGTRRARLGG